MGWVPPEPTTTITLPDGRVLACDDVGDPAGDVVVFLHGAPDCRLARHPDDALAAGAGVRLLAVDRPGYGASDPDPDLTFASFADDLAALLDELDVARCRLTAWSAGSPFGLAAATVLGPGRVERLTTYACIAPFAAFADEAVRAASTGRTEIAVAATTEDLTALVDELAPLLAPTPPVDLDFAIEVVEEKLGRRSRAELEGIPGALEAAGRSLAAAVDRHGDTALRQDLLLQFGPGELDVLLGAPCPVRLIHGGQDPICGPAVGEWLAARLADATVEVWPGATHRGLLPGWLDFLA